MNRTTFTLTAAAVLLLVGGAIWTLRGPVGAPPAAASSQSREAETSTPQILGLSIGDSVDRARETLDPLRVPVAYTPDAKETTGRRIYWKLRETEFDWVMVWGNAEGKITRIRSVYRPDKRKPFGEIGDLAQATSVTSEAAKWDLRRPGGPYYRLIAMGADHQAQTVYMFSLTLPGAPDTRGEPPPDAEN